VAAGVALGVALAVALVATPLAARVAVRLGVVDRPGPLKVQRSPVPYLGGVAVFVGVVPVLAVERPALLLPLGIALLAGLGDDALGLPVAARVGGQVAAGVAAVAVLPSPAREPLGAIATVLAVVGLVNACNLLDGLDGLAGGVALVAAVAFAVVDHDTRVPALALAGALAGFLVHNRPPARIYLGDAGAYLLGCALAVLGVLVVADADSWSAWAAVPLLVAVPVADTAVAIVRRVRSRRPLSSGDRGHLYDQLADRGLGRGGAVVACVALQVVLAAVGVVALGRTASLGVPLAAAGVLLLAVGLVAGGFLAATPEAAR
jgi:UDP-GlcNAc:undecaprenyl-phosphate GlcNAc-1-phosphate transferase